MELESCKRTREELMKERSLLIKKSNESESSLLKLQQERRYQGRQSDNVSHIVEQLQCELKRSNGKLKSKVIKGRNEIK